MATSSEYPNAKEEALARLDHANLPGADLIEAQEGGFPSPQFRVNVFSQDSVSRPTTMSEVEGGRVERVLGARPQELVKQDLETPDTLEALTMARAQTGNADDLERQADIDEQMAKDLTTRAEQSRRLAEERRSREETARSQPNSNPTIQAAEQERAEREDGNDDEPPTRTPAASAPPATIRTQPTRREPSAATTPTAAPAQRSADKE